MVSLKQKQQIKKLVDKNLDKDFQKFLINKKVKTRNGGTPSLSYIRIYLNREFKFSNYDSYLLAYWRKKIKDVEREKEKLHQMEVASDQIVNN